MHNVLGFQLSNRAYDALKDVVELWLPGIGALYFALSQIWELAGGEQVVGTCAALAVFGGLVLKISSTNFNKEYELIQEERPGVPPRG